MHAQHVTRLAAHARADNTSLARRTYSEVQQLTFRQVSRSQQQTAKLILVSQRDLYIKQSKIQIKKLISHKSRVLQSCNACFPTAELTFLISGRERCKLPFGGMASSYRRLVMIIMLMWCRQWRSHLVEQTKQLTENNKYAVTFFSPALDWSIHIIPSTLHIPRPLHPINHSEINGNHQQGNWCSEILPY